MRELRLKPVKMTEEIMQMLEDKGLIIRLAPGHHTKEIAKGDGVGVDLYVSDQKYGPHKLISVIIDRIAFSAFGTHEDNEEFMLIGGENEKTMYLLIAFDLKDKFMEKLENETLCEEDLLCLECVFNDPKVSFFTMLKDVPHGEATKDEDKLPATFYVTEPAGMGLDVITFKNYNICLEVLNN